MEESIIRVRENGPLLVQMPVKIVDHLGNEFAIPAGKTAVALCRCGHSASKPFCDGSHKRVGFQAAEPAGLKPETLPIAITLPITSPPAAS